MTGIAKSPVKIARSALDVARRSGPEFEPRRGPKRFTNHQLFALLVLRQFFRTDYRGIVAIVADSTELRRELGLSRLPHYSTLCYAEQRFEKKGLSSASSLEAFC
jgi:hypothetical protein